MPLYFTQAEEENLRIIDKNKQYDTFIGYWCIKRRFIKMIIKMTGYNKFLIKSKRPVF